MKMDVLSDNLADARRWMHGLMVRLYPLFRGLTGEGNRQTLAALAEHVPLRLHEAPTGERAYDWTVPQEWRFRDAYVKDRTGRRAIDARKLNLHVVGQSQPIKRTMTWAELRPHLHTLPAQREWVPYRRAFHHAAWGFCLSQDDFDAIEREALGPYEVCVDAEFVDGSLSYGEVTLPGLLEDEVLVSAHLCHPSLCNDNLSGIVLAAALAQRLAKHPRRHTMRFVFLPGTVGPIVYLSRSPQRLRRVRHGLVLTGVGDPGPLTYKRSRGSDTAIDRVADRIVEERGGRVIDFAPTGYDERQYNAPGFNLMVGALMRSIPGTYPQYHSSGDDASFVTADALADSLAAAEAILIAVDRETESVAVERRTPCGAVYRNLCPWGEPRLGQRGIIDALASWPDPAEGLSAVLWTLNLSDGTHGVEDIAARSGLSVELIERAVSLLVERELLASAERVAPTQAVMEGVA